MLNQTQNSILNLYSETMENTRTNLMEVIFKSLELKYNTTLSREASSNIYIFISNAVDGIIAGKDALNSFVNNMNSFFDNNKFDGYSSGTYAGLVVALKDVTNIEDVKISLLSAGTIAIILKLANDVVIEDIKPLVGAMIHKYISVGIATSVPTTTPQIEAIAVEVNASNGQAITYNFCECLQRKFNFKVTYFIDYEMQVADFDIQAEITSAIDKIYASKYYSIGKNFNVQDFYGVTGMVSGLKRILFTLEELDALDEVINTYEDIDVELADWEILIKNTISLIQGN